LGVEQLGDRGAVEAYSGRRGPGGAGTAEGGCPEVPTRLLSFGSPDHTPLIYPATLFRLRVQLPAFRSQKYFPTNAFVCDLLKTSKLLTKKTLFLWSKVALEKFHRFRRTYFGTAGWAPRGPRNPFVGKYLGPPRGVGRWNGPPSPSCRKMPRASLGYRVPPRPPIPNLPGISR
jgi:hypothetical protein